MIRGLHLLRLILSDLRRDWAMALCQACMIAAVLTPLLVLSGLRLGVLGRMLSDLEANPAMREIGPRVTGTNRFTEAWLAQLRARPDIVFAVGDARALAAEIELTPKRAPDHAPILAVMVPTGPGDPLAAGFEPPSGAERVLLSYGAAHALNVAAGDDLVLAIPRQQNGTDETVLLTIQIGAILPPTRMSETRRAVLASSALVLAIQHYRDGYAVPAYGWAGRPLPDGPVTYERFRLAAARLDDVGPLVALLRQAGIEPVSRLADITEIVTLDHGLGLILDIIALSSAAGVALALAALQWSAVERKQRELALLMLIGYGPGWLILLPLGQALLVALAGNALALGLFELAAQIINQHFPARFPACPLDPAGFITAGFASIALALAAAALAASRISRIEPALALRAE